LAQLAPAALEQIDDRMHEVDRLLAPGRRQFGYGRTAAVSASAAISI